MLHQYWMLNSKKASLPNGIEKNIIFKIQYLSHILIFEDFTTISE